MCNCGKKRNQLSQTSISTRQTNIFQPTQTVPSMERKSSVMFEYTGKTALSVVGNITRKSYRFHFTGDKQMIEYSDASSMMAIPVLKRVV